MAAAVAGTFSLATPYTLRSVDSLTTLGITEANNPSLFKIVREFYAEAGTGAELWLMGFPDTVKMSDMLDPTDTTKAKTLLSAANGRISGLIVSRTPDTGYTPVITNGLDADVALAMTNAQLLFEWTAEEQFAPIFTVLEGYAFTGNAIDLADLTTGDHNAVSVFIGDTVAESDAAVIGLVGGRLAKNGVSQNIAAVEDGTVATTFAFIKDLPVEKADIAGIHDKGYITFRTFAGRSGYFFNDDFTATLPTDDYAHLTARRTINGMYIPCIDAGHTGQV
jgi:hypothetical protein